MAKGASVSDNTGVPAMHAPVATSNTKLNKNVRKKLKRMS